MGKVGMLYADKQCLLGTETMGRGMKSWEFPIP